MNAAPLAEPGCWAATLNLYFTFAEGRVTMDESRSSPALGQRIDLMRETDVAYWCRIFDVTIDQLREAVRHAGHQVAEVRSYLISHPRAHL